MKVRNVILGTKLNWMTLVGYDQLDKGYWKNLEEDFFCFCGAEM